MKKLILIISGSSGVGKGTIVKELLKDKSLPLILSVSATSRKQRNGEIDGKQYSFFTKEKFREYIEEGKFLEYSEHFDNYYGTLCSEVENAHKSNKIPVLEIDVNGARDVAKKVKGTNKYKVISIFVLPPAKDDLIKRLKDRGSETEKEIFKRIERYNYEMEHKKYFTHEVVNDDLGEVVKEITELLKKEIGAK